MMAGLPARCSGVSTQVEFSPGGRFMKILNVLVFTMLAAMGTGAGAQTAVPVPVQKTPEPASRPIAAQPAWATGKVVEVYLADKQVLVEHGPIPSLGMSEMTMVFGVSRRRLLAKVHKGSQIRFAAKRQGDDYIITRLEVVN
jgi:Cu/Ag efflux protein CusF